MDNCILITVTELKQAIDNDKSIEDRFRTVMKKAKNHWLITNEDDQLRAAIGAVLVTATEEEKERINAELAIISALTKGGLVDWDCLGTKEEPIGILNLWKETER